MAERYFDVWPHEDEDTFAVRADQATPDEARAAVAREYALRPETLRYRGIEVWNLPEAEGQRGRRRRAHVFEVAAPSPEGEPS